MGTNSSLANLVVLATISSSILTLSYDMNNSLPKSNVDYEFGSDVSDWKHNAFHHSANYTFLDESSDKILAVLSFSKTIIENSQDLDGEIVDIVNENFWDLI